jgi:hypothetical protein
MKLPRGITGFRAHQDPPLPQSDFSRFKSDCYEIARSVGPLVSDVALPQATTNYGYAILAFDDQRIAVLLNAHYPFIAFAQRFDPGQQPFAFVNHAALAPAFMALGVYTVLFLEELEVPVSAEACQDLSPAEQRQVDYWRPRCLGQVIFNSWD